MGWKQVQYRPCLSSRGLAPQLRPGSWTARMHSSGSHGVVQNESLFSFWGGRGHLRKISGRELYTAPAVARACNQEKHYAAKTLGREFRGKKSRRQTLVERRQTCHRPRPSHPPTSVQRASTFGVRSWPSTTSRTPADRRCSNKPRRPMIGPSGCESKLTFAEALASTLERLRGPLHRSRSKELDPEKN